MNSQQRSAEKMSLDIKTRFFVRILGFILCFGSAILMTPCPASPSDMLQKKNIPVTKKISIVRDSETVNNKVQQKQVISFWVEVAYDAKSLQEGLSGRRTLPPSHGMLFLLDKNIDYSFWMKGMHFALDILFFDETGRLFDIFQNLVPCTECSFIKPSAPASFALEINAGTASKSGLRIGDKLLIE